MYKFSERLSAPLPSISLDVLNYFSSNNIYYSAGYGMPNCTAYALGRANELSNLNGQGYINVDGFAGNGGEWGKSGYIGQSWERGEVPMLGAIAVFEQAGRDGHVAVVEEIHENGLVKISNSGWSATDRDPSNPLWWWVYDDVDVHNHRSYTFLYFLYPPYIDGIPEPDKEDKKSWIVLALCGALKNNL